MDKKYSQTAAALTRKKSLCEGLYRACRNLACCAVGLEKILATKQHSVQLDRKERFRTLQLLQQQNAQLGGRLETLYEEFIDGAITRDEYVSKKKSISLHLEKHEQQIAALEQKTADSADNNKAAIEAFESYTAVDTLSDELSIQLLEQVKVHPNGELDIQLNFQDELEALAQAIQ